MQGAAILNTTSPHHFIDLDQLRYTPVVSQIASQGTEAQATQASQRTVTQVNREFVKGPIPIAWLSTACGLPGKALAVGLALWFESGRKRTDQVILTSDILRRFSVCRKAKYKALVSLETVGLIAVSRRSRKNPVVTILNGNLGGAGQ